MGTKRALKGQYFLFYIACVVVMVSGNLGCTPMINTLKAQQRLEDANHYVTGGDFNSALKANEEALAVAPDMFGDRALYQMALAYAHPENPGPDYQESARSLQGLRLDFPESPLKDEAGVWLHLLRQMTERGREIDKLNNSIAALERASMRKNSAPKNRTREAPKPDRKKPDQKINDLKEAIAGMKDTIQEKNDEIEELKNYIRVVQTEVIDLKAQIEQLKEIDLGIEEKKRKALPQ